MEAIPELRSDTCRMGSHSVTCQSTRVNAPRPALTLSTWMGVCLETGKPSRHVTSRLGQLNLSSLCGQARPVLDLPIPDGWKVELT